MCVCVCVCVCVCACACVGVGSEQAIVYRLNMANCLHLMCVVEHPGFFLHLWTWPRHHSVPEIKARYSSLLALMDSVRLTEALSNADISLCAFASVIGCTRLLAATAQCPMDIIRDVLCRQLC